MRQRSPGVWELRAYRGRDPVSGRPRQQSRTFRGGKRDAQKALNRLAVEVDKLPKPSTEETVAVLMRRHLEVLEVTGASPITLRNRRSAINKHLLPGLGDLPLNKLTAARLDAFYDMKLKERLAPSTVNNLHSILSAALELAVEWEWLGRNPAKRAHPPPRSYREYPLPALEDVEAVIEAAWERDPILAVLFILAVRSGARRAELCALQWQDVNWTKSTLQIVRNVKTKKARHISLDGGTLGALRFHKDAVEEVLAAPVEPGDWVFSHDGGRTPVTPDSVTQWLIYHRKTLNLAEFRFHDLRHLSVTTLLTAGVDARTVAGRHGHDTAIMFKRYSHFLSPADRKAAEEMGKIGLPSLNGRQPAG